MSTATTTEIADEVIELLEAEGIYDVEVHEDYSGRGMFGSTCVAYVGPADVDPGVIGWAYGRLDLDLGDVPRRQDSMGRGWVLY